MEQQLLDLFDTNPTFDNYIKLGNEFVYNALATQNHQYIHIIGNTLNGKTHLLKAWVNQMLTTNQKAIYINAMDDISVEKLRTLSKDYQYIAIDNVEMLNSDNQIAMFDLFNSIKLNNLNNILITSSNNSLEHNTDLRDDLKTRKEYIEEFGEMYISQIDEL